MHRLPFLRIGWEGEGGSPLFFKSRHDLALADVVYLSLQDLCRKRGFVVMTM